MITLKINYAHLDKCPPDRAVSGQRWRQIRSTNYIGGVAGETDPYYLTLWKDRGTNAVRRKPEKALDLCRTEPRSLSFMCKVSVCMKCFVSSHHKKALDIGTTIGK